MRTIYISLVTWCVTLLINTASAQTAERITGWRHNTLDNHNTLQLNDSLRYTYSAGRGAVAVDNMQFDTKTEVNADGNYLNTMAQFDADNNATQMEIQQWTGFTWAPSYRVLYTYDNSHRVTRFVQQQFYINTWYSIYKLEFEFNSHGDTTTYTTYNGDTSGAWTLNSKWQAYYNAQNRVIAQMDNMVINGNIIDTSGYTVFEYDNAGNLAKETLWINDTANLLYAYQQITYQYDGANILQNREKQLYQNGAWVPDTRNVYYYYPNNKLERDRLFAADGQGGLMPWSEFSYTYNNALLCDTVIWKEYDNNTANFEVVSRTVYEFNAAGKTTLEERQDPDNNGNYQPNWRTRYVYNTNNNLSYETFAYGGDTIANEETFYWYETYTIVQPTAIQEAENTGVKVYPVPASTELNVVFTAGAYSTLNLYATNGSLVLQTNIAPATTRVALPVNAMPAGNYLLQLTNGTHCYTQQVMVK